MPPFCPEQQGTELLLELTVQAQGPPSAVGATCAAVPRALWSGGCPGQEGAGGEVPRPAEVALKHCRSGPVCSLEDKPSS